VAMSTLDGQPMRPPSPEEVAKAYFAEHGEYVPDDIDEPGRRRRMAFGAGTAVAVVIVLVAAVSLFATGTVKLNHGAAPHHAAQGRVTSTTVDPPLVKVIQNASGSVATFDVHLSSFVVTIAAWNGPTSVKVTESGRAKPVDDEVLAKSVVKRFTITRNTTIVTGSPPARMALYEGSTFIGFYYPTSGPTTMNFRVLGKS